MADDYSTWTQEQRDARRQELLAMKNKLLEGSVVNKAPDKPLKEGFYARNVEPFGSEVAKGVPVAGAAVTQTPEMTDFENRHPWIAGAANAAGTLGGLAPIGRAASIAGEALPATGRVAANWFGQPALTYADAKARGANNSDAAMDAALAFALNGGQIVGTRAISPGLSEAAAEKTGRGLNAAIGAGIGGGAGYAAGLPTAELAGPILGTIIAENLPHNLLKPWLTNRAVQTFASGPMTSALGPTATQWAAQHELAKVLANQPQQQD